MDKEYYAHSLEGKTPSEWQRLDEHLNNVAEKARSCRGFCRWGLGLSCWTLAQYWKILERASALERKRDWLARNPI